MHKASLFSSVGSGKAVKCLACRHYCVIPENNLGKCKTRANIKGGLYSLVYGKNTGLQIDPVEKKPLFHFLPGSEILSFGTIGCNFICEFCQNWITSQTVAGSRSDEIDSVKSRIDMTSEKTTPKEIVKLAVKNKVKSIAYTYNEPGIFFEYTFDTAKLAKGEGIKNVYVSNGYSSKEALDMISPYLDAANIDLKSFNKEFYKKVCGANLDQVLESIKYYYKKGIWIELTTLLIPGRNDSEEEMHDIAKFIADISKDIPWHISRFTANYKMDNLPATDLSKIQKAYEIGKGEGLNYVYCGNIFNEKTQSTYCPRCKELLIKRDWGEVEIMNFVYGKCGNCGYKIPGVWK